MLYEVCAIVRALDSPARAGERREEAEGGKTMLPS